MDVIHVNLSRKSQHLIQKKKKEITDLGEKDNVVKVEADPASEFIHLCTFQVEFNVVKNVCYIVQIV